MEPIEKAVAKALAAKQRAFSDKNADSAVDGHLADQQADRPLNADNVSNADNARKMPDESVAANLAPTMSAESSQIDLNAPIEGAENLDSDKSTISEPGSEPGSEPERREADQPGADTAMPLGEQPAKPPLPVNSHHEPVKNPSADGAADLSQGELPAAAAAAAQASAEQLRRENARRQLFPNNLRGAPSNLPESATEPKDNSAISSASKEAGVAQPAPNGSLAMLDTKKLDELVSKRLEGNLDGSVEQKQEPNTDALNGLRMLDREFGNWERALRDGKKPEVLASQTRVNDLLGQIPESMASELHSTVNMLNEQTKKLMTPAAEKSAPEEESTQSKRTLKGRVKKRRKRKGR